MPQQFDLLKASAISQIQSDLEDAVEADRILAQNAAGSAADDAAEALASETQASLAALAAGAPIVTTLTDPVPADGTVELLKLDAGLQVHEVVAGAWVLRGWLVGPDFDTVQQLLDNTAATLGPEGQIVYGGGFRYEVVTTGEHVTTEGGVKLRVLAGVMGYALRAFGVKGVDTQNSSEVTAAMNACFAAAAAADQAVWVESGIYEPDEKITIPFGVRIVGAVARHQKGTVFRPTSAVSVGFFLSEIDSVSLENIAIDMSNMSNIATYTASTISFDASTQRIKDSANGLGDFSVGDVIGVQSPSVNAMFMVEKATVSSLQVTHLGATVAAGDSVTITAGPNGIRAEGHRRGYFKSVYVYAGDCGLGCCAINFHDGNRSTYYNTFIDVTTKPAPATPLGCGIALFSTEKSLLTLSTTNTFISCQTQGYDYGWMFGYPGSGVNLFNCNGESANTLGAWVADVPSKFTSAVRIQGGEWSDVDASETGALHMINAQVNGTVGANVMSEFYGRFKNEPVELNSIGVDDTTISSLSTNSDINVVPNGVGGVNLNTTSAIARAVAAHGGLEAYRATATTTANVFDIYSDVGGSQNLVCKIMADGDIENVNGAYGTISDRRLKQEVTPATSQWDDIKKVEMVNYKLIDHCHQLGDEAPFLLGVIAQQLEDAGMAALVKTDEDTGYKSVKTSILLLKALGALQEAMARIEALEKSEDATGRGPCDLA